jgi:hypothetical protein
MQLVSGCCTDMAVEVYLCVHTEVDMAIDIHTVHVDIGSKYSLHPHRRRILSGIWRKCKF